MSNLTKQFFRKPSNLKLSLVKSKKILYLEGPLGRYSYPLSAGFDYKGAEKKLVLKVQPGMKKSFFGLSHVLLSQAWLGSLLGYRRQLNIVGIGYQASFDRESNLLTLKLGFSHLVHIHVPDSITLNCPKPRILLLQSMNLQKLTNFAALLRSIKFPNPYKEKGIYYSDEKPKLKQGKKT